MTIQKSPRAEYPAEIKERVVRWLERAPRGSQKTITDALGVSDRTLRNWKKSCGVKKRRGRKQLRSEFMEVLKIVREWDRQGRPGARPVIKALPGVRVRLVRVVVMEMKLRIRRRARKHRARARVTVTVKEVGAVVAMDGATVRKGEDFIVYRDRGSLSVNAQACHGPLCSLNTLETLQKLKDENRLPLVLCTDNGSPFCSFTVRSFLDDNKIIHLRSLPHVAPQNGSAENAVKEFKEQVHAGKSAAQSCKTLNESRKRGKLNWITSSKIDSEFFIPYNKNKRSEFYESAKLAINQAVLGTKSGRERRKAEREAIFVTLERFELITRTRGGQTCAPNR